MSLKDRIMHSIADLVLVVDKLDKDADAETIAFRTEKCNKCKFKEGNKCTVCSCYIDLKVSAATNINRNGRKEVTHCPKGNWGDKRLKTFYNIIK